MVYESFSEKETREIAYKLASEIKPGTVVALSGTLSAGKTAFAKGFAAGLGIRATVTSPTFTILNEYHDGRLTLYHMDVYRITELSEMADTGYEDYFFGDGVCLIEWADIILNIIPDDALWILIEKDYSKPDEYRKITITERKRL